jgi:uncharacterized protein YxeA
MKKVLIGITIIIILAALILGGIFVWRYYHKVTVVQTKANIAKIDTIIPAEGPRGTTVTIKGTGLSGLEGDLKVIFERSDGKQIILTDSFGNYAKTKDKLIKINVIEPCQPGQKVIGEYSGIETTCDYVELTPGIYKVYVNPWDIKSNVVNFEITQPWCYTFSHDFGIGYAGSDFDNNKTHKVDDIYNLRTILIKEGLATGEGKEYIPTPNSMSGYIEFDSYYSKYTIKFQTKYGLSETGEVDAPTRAKLNELYGCK